MNALQKFSGPSYRPRQSTATLLRSLGLPAAVCVRNFWLVNHGKLDWILHDARKAYIALARLIHPRRVGDDDEQSKALNRIWDEVQRRFKAHIEPSLHIPRASTAPPPPRRHGEFSRVCQFERCRVHFTTTNRIKMYCCIRHGQQQGELEYERREKRKSKIFFRTCGFRRCGRPFRTTDSRKKFHSSRCAFRHHWNLWYHKYNALNRRKRNEYRARRANLTTTCLSPSA